MTAATASKSKSDRNYGNLEGLAFYAWVHKPSAETLLPDGRKIPGGFSIVLGLDDEAEITKARELGLNLTYPGEKRKVKGKETVMADKTNMGLPYIVFRQSTTYPDGTPRERIVVKKDTYQGDVMTDPIGPGSRVVVNFAHTPLTGDNFKFRSNKAQTRIAYLEAVYVKDLKPLPEKV